MTTAELRLAYKPDDEWLGELHAVVRSGVFAGEGTAWLGRRFLKETFVAALRAFPITATAPPMIEGGYWSKQTPERLDQCHVRLAIVPYNSRGLLLARIELASEAFEAPDSDLQHSVVARMLTEYSAIAEFAAGMDRILDGTGEQAILRGTPG